uniref:Uncharacterized protein n=1 Tax=Beihai mudskipper astro-like virus TaxID=2116128 RepID=A0A2P1GMA5_9VIRU|nr:hypothetical protein [Beihai mudskipper astro-like virus]
MFNYKYSITSWLPSAKSPVTQQTSTVSQNSETSTPSLLSDLLCLDTEIFVTPSDEPCMLGKYSKRRKVEPPLFTAFHIHVRRFCLAECQKYQKSKIDKKDRQKPIPVCPMCVIDCRIPCHKHCPSNNCCSGGHQCDLLDFCLRQNCSYRRTDTSPGTQTNSDASDFGDFVSRYRGCLEDVV